jgi:hypothetical protein
MVPAITTRYERRRFRQRLLWGAMTIVLLVAGAVALRSWS